MLSAYTFSKRQIDEERLNLSVLHLMQNNLMDLYGHPSEGIFVDETVEMTKTTMRFTYRIGQFLETNKSETSDFSSFLFDNIRLLAIIFLGYLSVVVVTSIAPKLICQNYSRIKSLKLIFFDFFFIDSKRLLSLSLKFAALVLAFNLFMFFNRNFLSAGIKTSKVLVNTGKFKCESLEIKLFLSKRP